MSPLKVVAHLRTLLNYAGELGAAEKSGDPERIAKAKKRHDDYAALCTTPGVEMTIGMTHGELYGPNLKRAVDRGQG